MRASLEETGAEKALLVGHSAGGWLARAALAEGKWEEGVASQDVVAGEAMERERQGWKALQRFLLDDDIARFLSPSCEPKGRCLHDVCTARFRSKEACCVFLLAVTPMFVVARCCQYT